jgi:hypothetical protein
MGDQNLASYLHEGRHPLISMKVGTHKIPIKVDTHSGRVTRYDQKALRGGERGGTQRFPASISLAAYLVAGLPPSIRVPYLTSGSGAIEIRDDLL